MVGNGLAPFICGWLTDVRPAFLLCWYSPDPWLVDQLAFLLYHLWHTWGRGLLPGGPVRFFLLQYFFFVP